MSKVRELSAKVSSRGQIVVPVDVRRHLGLVQGSTLRFVLAASGDVRKLKGRLARPDAPVTVEDMNRAVAERRKRYG